MPPVPARVLEVGCGDGELTRDLNAEGYEVIGIDPEAPAGPLFRRVGLEQFSDDESFEAVVANRSLHHVHDLDAGLQNIQKLLRADGVLVLNEFAWDRMDHPTAEWFLSHVDDIEHKWEALLPENFPEAWIEDHAGLHGFELLRTELGRHFQTELFEWTPYIAHYYLERDELEAEEKRLIDEGSIQALGFRYVGRPL